MKSIYPSGQISEKLHYRRVICGINVFRQRICDTSKCSMDSQIGTMTNNNKNCCNQSQPIINFYPGTAGPPILNFCLNAHHAQISFTIFSICIPSCPCQTHKYTRLILYHTLLIFQEKSVNKFLLITCEQQLPIVTSLCYNYLEFEFICTQQIRKRG